MSAKEVEEQIDDHFYSYGIMLSDVVGYIVEMAFVARVHEEEEAAEKSRFSEVENEIHDAVQLCIEGKDQRET